MDLVRRLENLAIVAMPIGAVIAGLSQYVVFPGSNYFGNYLYIGGYSLLSDSFAGMVEDIGNNLGNKMVQKIGRYYNEITISLLTTYFVLGETIIDWVPTNNMDPNDLYVTVLAGIIGCLWARGKRRDRMF